MITTINISGYRINFIFRHRFEKKDIFTRLTEWKDYKFGFWFKTYKSVGKPKGKPAVIGKGGSLSRGYMFGVDLIICKFWLDICHRPLILKLKDEKNK